MLHAISDYAKFDEIVKMSYVHSLPRVKEWPALAKWRAHDSYCNEQ
jgi:hypothetical protein